MKEGKEKEKEKKDNKNQFESPEGIREFIKKNKKREIDFHPYPEYDDPEFSEKIRRKKEFIVSRSTQAGQEASCSRSSFMLSSEQRFLRTFIHPYTPYRSILLFHGVGVGKCFAAGTPILMYDGSIELVENIRIGDCVMGDDSTHRIVQSLARGSAMMYKVIPEYGEPFVVNGDHVLCLIDKEGKEKVTMTVNDYLRSADKSRYLGYRSKLTFFPLTHPLFESKYEHRLYEMGFNYCPLKDSVPLAVKLSVPCDRSEFVAGFLDSFGKVVDERDNEYKLVIPKDPDIVFMLQSLGVCVSFDFFDFNLKGMKVSLFGSALYRLPCRRLNLSILCGGDKAKEGNTFRFCVAAMGESNYYGFSVDQNHQFLLGDFTVTHNSCAAISIAENFNFPNKVLVLLPPSLTENFKRQILNETILNANQCTGNKYVSRLTPKSVPISEEARREEAESLIEEKYEFMGFQKFANNPPSLSNRVVIVDEAHNMRDENEKDKQAPPILKEELMKSRNTVLILLTATPMYNESSEMVTLFNYMLANDGRRLIGESTSAYTASSSSSSSTSSTSTTLTTSTVSTAVAKDFKDHKQRITDLSSQYISYVPGENPDTFPKRIYATNVVPYQVPNKSVKLPSNRGYYATEMSEEQWKETVALMKTEKKEKSEEKEKEKKKPKKAVTGNEVPLRQLANVLFPNKGKFENTFSEVDARGRGKGKTVQYEYRKGAIKILNPENLATYAPKIKTVVDLISKSEGISYVYSFFKTGGAIPLAIALESTGYKPWDQVYTLPGQDYSDLKEKEKGKGNYAFLNNEDPVAFQNVLKVVTSPANKNGDLIKVLVGTNTSAEGIDLKNIRHIHILDPWYHNNKAEQVIGRGVRNCSHELLPKKDRNVTIYRHMIVTPQKKDDSRKIESIDYKMLRQGEEKQYEIDQVMNVITKHNLSSDWHSLGKDKGKKDKKIDESTFRTGFFESMSTSTVYEAFSSLGLVALTYDQIKNQSPTISDEELSVTLDRMLKRRSVGYVAINHDVKNGEKELEKFFLIYRDGYYILQPSLEKNLRISLLERMEYSEPRKRFTFAPEKEKEKEKDKKVKVKEIEEIEEDDEEEEIETDDEQEEEVVEKNKSVNVNVNVIEKVKQGVDELRVILRKLDPNLFNGYYDQTMVDYVIDRLQVEDMYMLILQVIREKDKEKEKENTFMKQVIKSLRLGKYVLESKKNVIAAWRYPRRSADPKEKEKKKKVKKVKDDKEDQNLIPVYDVENDTEILSIVYNDYAEVREPRYEEAKIKEKGKENDRDNYEFFYMYKNKKGKINENEDGVFTVFDTNKKTKDGGVFSTAMKTNDIYDMMIEDLPIVLEEKEGEGEKEGSDKKKSKSKLRSKFIKTELCLIYELIARHDKVFYRPCDAYAFLQR